VSRNALIKENLHFWWMLAAMLCWSLPARAQLSNALAGPSSARAQVYVVEDSSATDAFQARPAQIQSMLTRGITALAGNTNVAEAWRAFVTTQDVIGIKVFSEPGPNSGTRQAVVAGVIQGLLAAGIPTNSIIVWDKRLVDLRLAGFTKLSERFGIRLAGSADAGYDEDAFYQNSVMGTLVWGDFEFGRKGEGIGRKSFISKLVSQEITKIINITPLMNHNQAGVAGTLYSLALGSVENTKRFENDANRLASAVPEIYALPLLYDRVVLNIVDALTCQYEGEERSLLHYSTPLNQLRFSRDAVALDVLSIQELERQRQLAKAPRLIPNLELYSNAELLELGTSDPKKIQVIEVK
jgi:hypothetical protein